MLQSVVYAWKVTRTVTITCPAGLPGSPPAGTGFIDPASLAAAYRENAFAWTAMLLVLVLACYLTAPASLNRGFVLKWWLYWGAAMLLGALIPLVVLSLAPLHALAGSCSTNPLPFAAHLSFGQILPSMEAWALWSLAAFPLLSWLLTRLAGWHPAAGGFFHYRGCPWPRWNPFAS
jgi:hypothetical protein